MSEVQVYTKYDEDPPEWVNVASLPITGGGGSTPTVMSAWVWDGVKFSGAPSSEGTFDLGTPEWTLTPGVDGPGQQRQTLTFTADGLFSVALAMSGPFAIPGTPGGTARATIFPGTTGSGFAQSAAGESVFQDAGGGDVFANVSSASMTFAAQAGDEFVLATASDSDGLDGANVDTYLTVVKVGSYPA